MAEVRLSSKNQVVIPKDARRALGIKAGDKLIAVVRAGRYIVFEKPKSAHATLRGLASSFPDKHLEKERRSWE